MTVFQIWLLMTTSVALAAGFIFGGWHVVFVFALSSVVAGVCWAILRLWYR